MTCLFSRGQEHSCILVMFLFNASPLFLPFDIVQMYLPWLSWYAVITNLFLHKQVNHVQDNDPVKSIWKLVWLVEPELPSSSCSCTTPEGFLLSGSWETLILFPPKGFFLGLRCFWGLPDASSDEFRSGRPNCAKLFWTKLVIFEQWVFITQEKCVWLMEFFVKKMKGLSSVQ